jgi:hypothetical protein
MLQGPVHANSPLPSEQFGPQGTDPRMNDFRPMQSQTRATPSVPAHQQQQGFVPVNQSQMRPQPGTPAHLQGWPVGNSEAAINGGVQNGPNQPVGVPDGATQRPFMNGVGLNGVAGLAGPHTRLPPGATLLLRSSSVTAPSSTNGKT